MSKILFVSGSARNGNCKKILEELQSQFWLEISTDLVHIRDFELTPCYGCNVCENTPSNRCVKEDKMDILLGKVMDAEIVVLATPNYFYNVSSLTKNFIDKTFPCYFNKTLRGKKFIYIYTGNDSEANIKKYLDNSMYGFTICHELNVLGTYAFSCDGIGEFSNPQLKQSTISQIINKLRENI